MKPQNSTLLTLLLGDLVSAVDIMHYRTDPDCMGAPFVTCPDFPEGLSNCCKTPDRQNRARSTRFVGLIEEPPTQQGIAYTFTLGSPTPFCGTANNAGFGYRTCLSNPPLNGATGANCEFKCLMLGLR